MPKTLASAWSSATFGRPNASHWPNSRLVRSVISSRFPSRNFSYDAHMLLAASTLVYIESAPSPASTYRLLTGLITPGVPQQPWKFRVAWPQKSCHAMLCFVARPSLCCQMGALFLPSLPPPLPSLTPSNQNQTAIARFMQRRFTIDPWLDDADCFRASADVGTPN